MTIDDKIAAALEVDSAKIDLPDGLLDRIRSDAEKPASHWARLFDGMALRTAVDRPDRTNRQTGTVSTVRPSLWSRLQLRPKLEFVAACILLTALVGVAGYRNLNSTTAPAGDDKDPGSSSQASIPRMDVPELTRMSRAVVIGTVKVKLPSVTVKEQEGGRTIQRVYADYQFAVEESLRGSYTSGQEITLRLSESGRQGYRFQAGDHVLIFLASNTGPNGEAYILTAEQGIYDIGGETAHSRLQGSTDVALAELKAAIQHAHLMPTPWLPTVTDVKRAYFSGFPGAGQQSLDQSTVATVLGWLNKAQVVGTDRDNFWRRGSDFYLVMELQGGGRVVVRLAEDCVATQTTDSTRHTCNYAEGHVNLITLESEAPRLRAQELADWLKGQAAHLAPPANSGDPANVDREQTEDRERIENTILAQFAALADERKGWLKYPADNPEAKKNLDLIERKLSVLEQIQRDYIEGNKSINELMKELEDLPKNR